MSVKVVDVQEELKRSIAINELRKYGFRGVEGMSYRELKNKLAVYKIKEDKPGNGWY